MKIRNIALAAGVLIAGVTATTVQVKAQGPMYDKVIVDLPYRVTLNETALEPGHYVIRQLDSPGGGSRVLQIFTDNGMRLKTSTLTIPTLDNNTPESTRVILHHYGNDYYFDKIWIQGKNYGYEFPLPAAVKARERERMEAYTVPAKYETTSENTENMTATTKTETNENVAPAPVTPAPSTTDNSTATTSTVTTSNEVAQSAAPVSSDTTTSNAPVSMPHTAGNWLSLLLSGGMLSGAGMLLRRK